MVSRVTGPHSPYDTSRARTGRLYCRSPSLRPTTQVRVTASGRAISEGWRGSAPTTMEASMALPRERTFVYHLPEAVAALISSGEAHFQHSPSRGGKRELGAEGAASLSISSHGACQPAPRARDGCSRRAACAARASGTARLTRGHVPRSPGRPRTRTPCGPGKPPPTSLNCIH